MGLEDFKIAITLVAFFGIPCWLIYRRFFKPRGPAGSLHCWQCGGSGHLLDGVCTACEGKGWRWP